MKKLCLALAYLLSLSLGLNIAEAAMPLTFQTQITMDLCPEYPYGNVTLEVDYTVGNAPTIYPADIVSQEINTTENTATLVLRFPSTYVTVPFHIMAYCQNQYGTSDTSNVLDVSNCDALALFDSDGDGIPNNQEDINCDNSFSPGDLSNPDNVDTDGDGVRDLVERVNGTDATNPGSSPRPFIYSAGVFDPDSDGNSNPVVWRNSTGTWYIKDFTEPGTNLALFFGQSGDIPFTYSPKNAPSNVGVIRNINNQLHWLFNGPGFLKSDGTRVNNLSFGIFGDNIVLGPWEREGVTNPAVARLYNGEWYYYIYLSDGSIRMQNFGGNGDIPKPEDHDGDGLFDLTFFRPAAQKTYTLRSADNQTDIYNFGTGTADHTVRGDYDGDDIDDISFWEPQTAVFSSMKSENGFNDMAANDHDLRYYFEEQLGLYQVFLPLNWNKQNGLFLFTVVDHGTGNRYIRPNNNRSESPAPTQWGIAGDSQG